MKVSLQSLGGTDIERMEVTEAEASDVHVGESVGYICPHCKQCDESLHQIWHEEDCELAGNHGRKHYDEMEPKSPERPTPELEPDHEISIVHAGVTIQDYDIQINQTLAFRCDCGNLDEDLFEVVHDERCSLATCEQGMTHTNAVPVSNE